MRFTRIHPDRETETHVQLGTTRRHRRPVAGMKRADIEQVRALDAGELGLPHLVQGGFELVQGGGDGEGGLDRIRALVGMRRMPRAAFERDPRPDDAGSDQVHRPVGRLADHDSVGSGSGKARGERAVPAALLLDHALVDERPRERACRFRRLDCKEHRGDAALHVTGSSPVEEAVVDFAPVRRLRPPVGRFFADHVDVPVEQE